MRVDIFNRYCQTELDVNDWFDRLYPLTIVRDKYKGEFSGGRYTVWPVYEIDVPFDQHGSERVAKKFWEEIDKSYIGIGVNIDTAIDDLFRKIARKTYGN